MARPAVAALALSGLFLFSLPAGAETAPADDPASTSVMEPDDALEEAVAAEKASEPPATEIIPPVEPVATSPKPRVPATCLARGATPAPLTSSRPGGLDLNNPANTAGYYNDAPACNWTAEQQATLLRAIKASYEHGLNPERFHYSEIAAASGGTPDRKLGWVLTDAAITYAYVMTQGEIDIRKVEEEILLPRVGYDATGDLRRAVANDDLANWLESLPPDQPGYERLVAALGDYRAEARYGARTFVPSGPTIGLGDIDKRVPTIRTRLEESGDLSWPEEMLTLPSPEPVVDTELSDAIKHFQRRMGLVPDGRLGPNTLTALNTPPAERVDQIRVNLVRWRAMSRFMTPTRVEVNIPGYSATLYRKSEVIDRMRVIVGETKHPTPIMVDEISQIVINPRWHVPKSILENELRPKINRDPNYMKRNHMIWWKGILVQEGGPWNSLGRIKFDFPNRYAIYLHDTPGKRLFNVAYRARSHGCVRVQHPIELAELLLQGSWTRDRIEKQIDSMKTRYVKLDNPTTVVLAYWTAQVEEDGTLAFYSDVYGQDERIQKALDADERRYRSYTPLTAEADSVRKVAGKAS